MVTILKVHVEYFDKNVEKVDEEDIPIDVYCLKLAHETLKILEKVEDMNVDRTSSEFKEVRHRIFDVCGALQRLPNEIS